MSLLQFIGPYGKDGETVNRTRVIASCDNCGFVWGSSLERYQEHNGECQYCRRGASRPLYPNEFIDKFPFVSSISGTTKMGFVGDRAKVLACCDTCDQEYEQLSVSVRKSSVDGKWECELCRKIGPPRTPEIVFSTYSRVRDILTVSSRNHVSNTDKVVVCCSECEREFVVDMKGVSRQGADYWRCFDCGRESVQKYMLLPDELPHEIHKIKYDTLGSGGKVVNSTVVHFNCSRCGGEIRQIYGNYLKSSKLCKSCNTAVRWEDDEYRSWYSQMMEEKWLDNDTRKAFMDGRSNDNGFLSKIHQDLKVILSDIGIDTFSSEKWICDYKYRVDELDEKNRLIIEVYGDFWHASHTLYHDNDYVDLPGGGDYAKNIRYKDDVRINEIESLGYKVYIAWECDINNNKEWLINDLLEWYYN